MEISKRDVSLKIELVSFGKINLRLSRSHSALPLIIRYRIKIEPTKGIPTRFLGPAALPESLAEMLIKQVCRMA